MAWAYLSIIKEMSYRTCNVHDEAAFLKDLLCEWWRRDTKSGA